MSKFLQVLAFAALVASPVFAQQEQQQQQQQQQQNPPTPQAQQGSSAPAQQPQNPPPAQPKKETRSAKTRKKTRTLRNMPKIEVAAAPTFQRASAPAGYYLNMYGWTASGEYNLWSWLGGQVEASGAYSHRALIGSTSEYTLMAGPQFFPLRHHKITPWGHFLFGQGYYRDSIPAFGGFPAHVNGAFSFAWEGGAGLDFNVKQHWGLRFPEFDYVSTNFFGGQPNQPKQSNYRLEVGIIYRIGRR